MVGAITVAEVIIMVGDIIIAIGEIKIEKGGRLSLAAFLVWAFFTASAMKKAPAVAGAFS